MAFTLLNSMGDEDWSLPTLSFLSWITESSINAYDSENAIYYTAFFKIRIARKKSYNKM